MSETPSPILSESEALRRLNLPASHRSFLREQLAHAPVGKSIAYQRRDVDELAGRLTASQPGRASAACLKA
jgi:hypothetical protein